MRKGRQEEKLHMGCQGMAMTEVMIAFLLLTILFGLLYHCIRFSSQMMGKAADIGRENERYEEAVQTAFQKTPSSDPYHLTKSGEFTITFADAGGNTTTLTADTAKKDVPYTDSEGQSQTAGIWIYNH